MESVPPINQHTGSETFRKAVSSSQVTRWFHAFQHGPASQSRLEPCWDEVAIGELIQTDTVEIKLLWFNIE